MTPEADRMKRAMALLAIVISCCVMDPFNTVTGVNWIVMSMIGL